LDISRDEKEEPEKLKFAVPFYLAPMAEISHRAFRELIEEFGGCDLYYSEMISAKAVFSGGPFEKWYIDSAPRPEKLIFQVVGDCPDAISKAAAFLDSLDCAGIDINMGCSAPLIRKKGGGAAWMASIDNAGSLISKVRQKVKKRLSVKLRTGFKDDFDYLVRFCRRLEEEGVELITLHPRLVSEKFKRLAKWEYVGALKKELKIPVAGNGDISDASDLLRRAASTCDAVMIGRAAVKQPWIFAQAKRIIIMGDNKNEDLNSPSAVPRLRGNSFDIDIKNVGLRFIELLARHQPPEFHASRAKRFFSFFCQNLKWGTNLFNQINREETLAGIEKTWREHFENFEDLESYADLAANP